MFLIQLKKTMKNLEFIYSLKNIPIPSKLDYQKALTDKVEKFLARIRWKVFWYRNQGLQEG